MVVYLNWQHLLNVKSEDFYTEALIDIGIEGELSTYRDEQHNVQSKVFASTGGVYLKVELCTNDQVTLESCEIVELHVGEKGANNGVFFITR